MCLPLFSQGKEYTDETEADEGIPRRKAVPACAREGSDIQVLRGFAGRDELNEHIGLLFELTDISKHENGPKVVSFVFC